MVHRLAGVVAEAALVLLLLLVVQPLLLPLARASRLLLVRLRPRLYLRPLVHLLRRTIPRSSPKARKQPN